MIEEIHKGCGGKIVDKQCDKCNKKWNKFSYYLSSKEFETNTKPDFDANAYRRRLRSGRDIRSDK